MGSIYYLHITSSHSAMLMVYVDKTAGWYQIHKQSYGPSSTCMQLEKGYKIPFCRLGHV